MTEYYVRQNQNIFDVAMTVHGSIEGIYDLLISNTDLSIADTLQQKMTLEYHGEECINSDLVTYLEEQNIIVANGQRPTS